MLRYLAALVLLAPVAARADTPSLIEPEVVAPEAPHWALDFSGYGELTFAYLAYGPNQNRPGGAQHDSRLVFDTTRLALEIEGHLPLEFEFEAEVEFEHGGTGAALELEYDEFGEFETEVEKGGEAIVEELFIEKHIGDHAVARLGRFYVGIGLTSQYFRPTQYLAVTRPAAETQVIPVLWDEMGADVTFTWHPVRLQLQLVNGLDSTGFSSQNFVVFGHQGKFEQVNATNLAGVARVGVTPLPGLIVGGAAYYGGTSRNRPKPDLALDCGRSNDTKVAPCGFLRAPLFIGDLHLVYERGPVRAKAVALYGHLSNSVLVSERNARLSNALPVLRSAVARAAISTWGEVGFDIGRYIGMPEDQFIEPFVRVEYYDTMWKTAKSQFDNPRFERFVVTAGAGWRYAEALVFKIDAYHRKPGGGLRAENGAQLGGGFSF